MIIAIIQARMGSTRLPGKVLEDILGKPLLQHVIERVRQSRLIDDLVVATTRNSKDLSILVLTKKLKIKSYRGSENDVLDRFYHAAKKYSADTVVRITADDPFKDPRIIDRIIKYFLTNRNRIDYVSNTIEYSYPLGLDVEVFTFKALKKTWEEARQAFQREHVTPYMRQNPQLFRLKNIKCRKDISQLRWTIDTNKDLEFAREVYKYLYRKKRYFLMSDILNLLNKYPQLRRINQNSEKGRIK